MSRLMVGISDESASEAASAAEVMTLVTFVAEVHEPPKKSAHFQFYRGLFRV